MVIVENQEEFSEFLTKFNETPSLIIPIFTSDELHPSVSGLSALFVAFQHAAQADFYLIPINHTECINLEPEKVQKLVESDQPKRVFNTKSLIQTLKLRNCQDIESLYYLNTNYPLETKAELNGLLRKIKLRSLKYHDTIRVVPITKIIQYCKELFDELQEIEDKKNIVGSESYDFINKTMIPAFAELEKNGIAIEYDRFMEVFGERFEKHLHYGLINSQYNLFTSTGRPANRFASINYAALKKEGGERDPFVSRFGNNGMLVMFDYDAYHLRLLAELTEYDFGEENIHEHLAKNYFDIDTVTPEQYDESKQKTFKILYGGVTKEWESIEFFKKVKDYTESLFGIYQRGELKSIISGRDIVVEDPNPQKVLNYLIQLYESEMNALTISSINDYLQNFKTKLVLYTYDSFLFDFSMEDGKPLLSTLKNMIITEKNLKTKEYYGKNYGEMRNIVIK